MASVLSSPFPDCVTDLSEIDKEQLNISWKVFPEMEINPVFQKEISEACPDKDSKLLFLCRSGLLKNVADHLTKMFAGNLEARLSGAQVAEMAPALDAGKYVRALFWDRFLLFIRRLIGK